MDFLLTKDCINANFRIRPDDSLKKVCGSALEWLVAEESVQPA